MSKPEWSESMLLPVAREDIARLRARCLRLVKQRAAIAAAVAAVPLPGVDLLSDLATFALLVEEINKTFGLTPQQIDRLHPRLRIVAYEAAAALGGMLVGKIVTRELVLKVFRKAGVKLAAKTAAKAVPLAGQVASAALGFALFRKMGYQHVEACVKVAEHVAKAAPKS
jgi:uncharacterized protein (DUF697 family)